MRFLCFITKIICFPGTYLRGFWEHITCKLLRLQVEPVGYLRLDESCGHVEHSLAKTQFSAFLMATGPGFMNFNMGMAFWLFGFLNVRYMGITPWDSVPLFILYVASMYLGVSLLCNVFPLTEDILNYWNLAYGPSAKKKSIGRSVRDSIGLVLGFPFALITRVGAFLDRNCILFFLWVVYIVVRFVVF